MIQKYFFVFGSVKILAQQVKIWGEKEQEKEQLFVSVSFLGGTESAEAEDERQRHAQASWVQRMLTSIMGDSTLFTTREGRAGKVHNFMLGLNLNSSLPFSPFSGIMSQTSVDEEVDAVTGTN